MSVDDARKVADAVLYEGYILYPYRASHGKNAPGVRWQFGVLVPQRFAGDNPLPAGAVSSKGTVSGAVETWYQRTECIVDRSGETRVAVRLRFLQIQRRVVEAAGEDGTFTPVESLDVGGTKLVTWDEGIEHEFDSTFTLDELCAAEQVVPVDVPGGLETESLRSAGGTEAGRVVRTREAISLRLRVSAEPLPGPYGIARLRVVTENVTDWSGPGAERAVSLMHSPVATHVILALEAGRFVSLLDPPEWAKPAVASCTSEHTWPVLVGSGAHDTMLSSPMVLPDFPEIAPESPMDLFDGTENDELLSLRIMTLTEEEKAEMRATDPRAAAILDSVDNMPPEILDRLHGAIRSLEYGVGPKIVGASAGSDEFPEIWNNEKSGEVLSRPVIGDAPAPLFDPAVDASYSPDSDTVEVAGARLSRGSRVRLRPGLVRSDAQDMFLEGRTARVEAVLFDADEEPYLAVVLDDDPGADIHVAHGRFLYFKPYEIEPLEETSR